MHRASVGERAQHEEVECSLQLVLALSHRYLCEILARDAKNVNRQIGTPVGSCCAARYESPWALRGFAQAPAQADPIVVPAKLDAEGLSEFLIPVKVRDNTFWCNLDSGGSWVFSMDTAKAQKAGLRPNATGSHAGVGPGVVTDQRVQGENAGIGSLMLRNLTIVLRTFPTVAPDMDCVFGLGLLQDYVVEFDYLTPRLRIFEAANFKASTTAVAVPFEIDRFRNPFIETRISLTTGNDVRASLILDTGGG